MFYLNMKAHAESCGFKYTDNCNRDHKHRQMLSLFPDNGSIMGFHVPLKHESSCGLQSRETCISCVKLPAEEGRFIQSQAMLGYME